MKNNFSIVTLIQIIILLSTSLQAADKPPTLIYAFSGYGNQKAKKLMLVGEVVEIGKMPTVPNAKYTMGYDMRLGKITVKIDSPEGLQEGQDLTILRKNPDHKHIKAAQVVGLLTIYSINKTSFSGWILIGTGHFTQVSKGDFVAKAFSTSSTTEAFEAKRQADYYFQKGWYGKAIAFYKKAISLNNRYPEAHLGLALAYGVNPENYIAAKNELKYAFQQINLAPKLRHKMEILMEYFKVLELEYSINSSYLVSTRNTRTLKVLKKMENITNKGVDLIPSNTQLKLNQAWASFYNWKYYLNVLRQQAFTKSNRTIFDSHDKKLKKQISKLSALAMEENPGFLRLKILYDYYLMKNNHYRSSVKKSSMDWSELTARCQHYLQFKNEPSFYKKEVAQILEKLASN